MSYAAADKVRARRERAATNEGPERGPGWATVIVVVATLAFIALPRAIAPTGLSPILVVVGAIVLVLWLFGKE
jgi:hypothetical protein